MMLCTKKLMIPIYVAYKAYVRIEILFVERILWDDLFYGR